MSRDSFEIRHIVTFEETNVVGNVYYTNYFLWQGQCRELFLREHAPQILHSLQSGQLKLVTAHASCDYFDEFVSFDEVRLRMSLNHFIPFGVSLGFEYARKAELADGEAYTIVARGRQDIKFLSRTDAGWALFEIPQALMEVFRRYE